MESWQPIVYMTILSVVITILYLFLLQWMTMCLLYVSIALVFFAFVAMGAWSFWMSTQYPPGSEWEMYARVGAGFSFALALIYMICVCCCWSNIALGATILKVAAGFLTKNLRMVFLPILSSFFIAIFGIWWLACASWIYTIGDVVPQENSFFAAIQNNDQIHYLMWFFLFCLFWTLAFISSYQVFVIAATVAQYYFSGAAAGDGG